MTSAAPKWIRRRRTPMRMVIVTDSTNIAAVGYSKSKCVLRVRFRDGSEYEYENVPRTPFLELMDAPSIGVHFAAHIKGQYKCWRLNKARARARTS